MPFVNETRFRLRIQTTIVGYVRIIDGKSKFFSKDGFFWSGRKIDHNEIDEWTGYFDKNKQAIYEWDILTFKIDPDGEDHTGVVLWEANQKRFVIRNVNNELYFPFETNGLKLFSTHQLKVFSYLFLNPNLKHELGFDDD